MMPGYVFVYSDLALPYENIRRVTHVLRLLRYNELDEGFLVGRDRAFAEWLLKNDGRVGALAAIREGSRVKIVDGLFKEMQGRVVRMDLRKQIAKVEMDVVGDIRGIWLSFQFIDVLNTEKQESI